MISLFSHKPKLTNLKELVLYGIPLGLVFWVIFTFGTIKLLKYFEL